MYCLTKRKNLFIEKPPGLSVSETQEIASTAREKGCCVMVGFNRRYIPLLRAVKKRVEEKGIIIQSSATFFGFLKEPFYGGKGDLMTHLGIHAVDTLRWVSGEVRNVKANIRRNEVDFDNCFNVLLEFQNGAVGHITIIELSVSKETQVMVEEVPGKRAHMFD